MQCWRGLCFAQWPSCSCQWLWAGSCCVEQSSLTGISSVIRNAMTAKALEDTGTGWEWIPRRPVKIVYQWSIASLWKSTSSKAGKPALALREEATAKQGKKYVKRPHVPWSQLSACQHPAASSSHRLCMDMVPGCWEREDAQLGSRLVSGSGLLTSAAAVRPGKLRPCCLLHSQDCEGLAALNT